MIKQKKKSFNDVSQEEKDCIMWDYLHNTLVHKQLYEKYESLSKCAISYVIREYFNKIKQDAAICN